jgi:asparagine synthase (glutamine-hydrolysing)
VCGIAGFVQAGPVSESDLDVLRSQLSVLEHRGPDSTGAIGVGPAAIGQTRLAVIDLVTGDPPITNEDGVVAVAFNGEIYNFRGLRDRLVRGGHMLATQGDTEVIAHLAEELSPLALAQELDGMFAFAVWDDRARRLVLARDPFGKKPVFWWHGDGLLVFASEIKGVLEHPAVPRRLNERAIVPYLTFGYAPTPATFFDGVRSLPPGHVLTMGHGEEPVITEYWRPPLPPRRPHARLPTLTEAVTDVRQLVREAVSRRLISDVPLGAFLSGGIDSTVVVAMMAELTSAPVKTFTVGFDERGPFDERPFARLVARRFETDHTEFVVQPNAIELLDELLWHHDQPFGDSSAIPTFLLSKCTREHVTVALSGDGGDELFAGYERFAAGLLFADYLRLPRRLRAPISASVRRLPPAPRTSRLDSARRFLASGDVELLRTFANWVAYFPEDVRQSMVGAELAEAYTLASYREVWDDSEGRDVLARLLDLNARTYLLDDLLVKTDRMSMAHALEVRSPFLDRQLAEYLFGLPGSLKIKRFQLKYLLRRAFAGEIPDAILSRRKQGFAIPLDRWFREDLSAYAESCLGAGARVREHLNPVAVDEVLAAHRSGQRNYGHGIWALLTLELFLRREGW